MTGAKHEHGISIGFSFGDNNATLLANGPAEFRGGDPTKYLCDHAGS